MRPYGFLQGCSDEYHYWKYRAGREWRSFKFRYNRKYREECIANRKAYFESVPETIRKNADKISESIQGHNLLLSRLKGE